VSAHTPGPWTVESDGSTVSMGGQCVIVGPAPERARREEERANARLIAATRERPASDPWLIHTEVRFVVGREVA